MYTVIQHKLAHKVLIALFFLTIWTPLLGSLFKWNTSSERSILISEYRFAAKFPNFRWEPTYFDRFPDNFEAYYNDFFGFRKILIFWHNYSKLTVFGSSPSPLVVLGQDHWLFFRNVESYYHSPLFTPKQLMQIKYLLEKRNNWLKSQGIQYIFLVAPNKESIYPEYLPISVKYHLTYSRFDQLMDYLKRNSDLEIVDLRQKFHQAKAVHQLYEKTDTHWNDVGAFYAYQSVMERVTQKYRFVRPLDLSAFQIISVNEAGGDLARFLQLQETLYREESLKLIPQFCHPVSTELEPVKPGFNRSPIGTWSINPRLLRKFSTFIPQNNDKFLPKAVIFGDSFSQKSFVSFLRRHFRQTTFVARPVMDVELIQQEHPNVVIQEVVERSLLGPISDVFFNSHDLVQR